MSNEQTPQTEDLEKDIGSAKWLELAEQLARDTVIIISPEISLGEAGAVIARDDSKQVNSWIESGLVAKPSIEQINSWQKENPRFVCLVLKPFVLIQLPS